MQKISLFIVLFLFLGFVSVGQLAQTRWKGTLLIPNQTDAILNFKKDTMEAIIESGGFLEASTYTIKADTILVKKVSGPSTCGENATGKYKWAIEGDRLTITPISDDCSDRAGAWPNTPFIKIKD